MSSLTDEEAVHSCGVCGSDLTLVRPGKYQCEKCELTALLESVREEEREQCTQIVANLKQQLAELQRQLQEDTYCAYCGHKYPKGTPRFGGNALTEHIKVCPEHPMRECERELAACQAKLVKCWPGHDPMKGK